MTYVHIRSDKICQLLVTNVYITCVIVICDYIVLYTSMPACYMFYIKLYIDYYGSFHTCFSHFIDKIDVI